MNSSRVRGLAGFKQVPDAKTVLEDLKMMKKKEKSRTGFFGKQMEDQQDKSEKIRSVREGDEKQRAA